MNIDKEGYQVPCGFSLALSFGKGWLQNLKLEFEFFFHTGLVTANWGKELASQCCPPAEALEARVQARR